MPNDRPLPRSRPGRKPANDQFVFGTEAEVQDRNPNRSLYTEFLPDANAPAFTQIPPQPTSGRSINGARAEKNVGGHIKFAGGPGVPGK